ncbi:MAG: hypothetical protein JRH11_01835 [Deltaproteobacteria bacterium]|nr:hypothetical protein [Deltaproteobacteria bacterium]
MASSEDKAPHNDSEEDPEAGPEPLPGQGSEEGERLRSAEGAFERGDYVEVRRVTRGLLEASDDGVAAHARGLLHRTQIDPIQVVVILACLALFSTIAYLYVLT